MNPEARPRCLLLTKLLVFLLLFSATGCFWGDEYGTKQLTGHYYLSRAEPSSDYWYLYFEEKDILGEPLLNRWVESVEFNNKCIVMRSTGTSPQFYVARITGTEDREVARGNLMGPLTKKEFQIALLKANGDTLLPFNSSLTKSRW